MLEKVQHYIKKWESQGYHKGLPDEADLKLEGLNMAPSYRAIVKAILKNDSHLTSLGFSKPKCFEYGILKRIELAERAKKMNVFEASKQRIKQVFSDFDNVYVSFSGGKDSGVLLNLAIEVLREFFPSRKLGVFHIDYEAQYQMTTDYVDSELSKNSDILEVYRICLPIAAACATSAYSDHWIPWDRDKLDLWVRGLPLNSINEMNHEFSFFKKGMRDYEFQDLFSGWIHTKKNAKKTACLVGIRTDESLNRWRAIHSDNNQNKYNDISWSKQMDAGIYNFYPIFDWKVDDVWIANAKNEWEYNKLYDLFYKAGLKPSQMRVASPFHDCGIENLKLYKVIDPNNWGKMIGRTSGVNFAGLYGGTTAMGWRSITLPPGHTWKTYMDFLLATLPESASEQYRKKLKVSQDFWKNTGGALSDEIIKKLRKLKIPFKFGKASNRNTEKKLVKMEYLDDIEIEEFREIPTYKRMCICIMKNDHLCKFMGFSLNKTEIERRAIAENKYKNIVRSKK